MQPAGNTRTSTTTILTKINGVMGNLAVSIPPNQTGFFLDSADEDNLSPYVEWEVLAVTGDGSETFTVENLLADFATEIRLEEKKRASPTFHSFGTKKCWFCHKQLRSAVVIEKAHLVARIRGGNLTVPLCLTCHKKWDKGKATKELKMLHISRRQYLGMLPVKSIIAEKELKRVQRIVMPLSF
jgi:hypothetical protein